VRDSNTYKNNENQRKNNKIRLPKSDFKKKYPQESNQGDKTHPAFLIPIKSTKFQEILLITGI